MSHRPRWYGTPPERCDLCQAALVKRFIDGATGTAYGGLWAVMCVACHQTEGRGLGVGRGQAYAFDGTHWLKERP